MFTKLLSKKTFLNTKFKLETFMQTLIMIMVNTIEINLHQNHHFMHM